MFCSDSGTRRRRKVNNSSKSAERCRSHPNWPGTLTLRVSTYESSRRPLTLPTPPVVWFTGPATLLNKGYPSSELFLLPTAPRDWLLNYSIGFCGTYNIHMFSKFLFEMFTEILLLEVVWSKSWIAVNRIHYDWIRTLSKVIKHNGQTA